MYTYMHKRIKKFKPANSDATVKVAVKLYNCEIHQIDY